MKDTGNASSVYIAELTKDMDLRAVNYDSSLSEFKLHSHQIKFARDFGDAPAPVATPEPIDRASVERVKRF